MNTDVVAIRAGAAKRDRRAYSGGVTRPRTWIGKPYDLNGVDTKVVGRAIDRGS
jgi:hypothetical protein